MKIEFTAADGLEYAMPVLTLSVHGVSFTMPRRIQGIENGGHLADVVIRVGKVQVRGNLVIVYCGRKYGSDYTCGAQLHPLGEADSNELIVLVSRLDQLAKA
jgi:hypothetical protein